MAFSDVFGTSVLPTRTSRSHPRAVGTSVLDEKSLNRKHRSGRARDAGLSICPLFREIRRIYAH